MAKDTVKEALKIFNNNWNHQIILYGPPGTSKTYSSTIIAASFLKEMNDKDIMELSYDEANEYLKNEAKEQYQIVQFHPSYNYDDFVRGIKMSIENGNPKYEVVNKIFGEFADKAHKDVLHQMAVELEKIKGNDEIEIDETVMDELVRILEKIKNKDSKLKGLLKNEDTKKLKELLEKEDSEKLKGLLKNEDTKKLKELLEKEDSEKLKELLKNEDTLTGIIKHLHQLSRYVLVIDEINRAPLASVLGEMIYSLEYRNQPISTSYKIEGGTEEIISSDKIIIPDNLYIIGTMNTADRSIGTIDYAVRRRFAFIPVLPDWDIVKKSWEDVIVIDKDGNEITVYIDKDGNEITVYIDEAGNEITDSLDKNDTEIEKKIPQSIRLVKKLWDKIENLEYNTDVNKEDVQIGHTYFVFNKDKIKTSKSDDNRYSCTEKDIKEYLEYRLDYEIKPILREYQSDEILPKSINIDSIKVE